MAKTKNKKYNKILVIEEIVEVPEDAIATSIVAGTPQDARIAVLNASNQTIYLSAGSSNNISGGGLIVKGSTIIEGETYEVSEDLELGSFDAQLDVESVWIQNEEIANYCLYIISAYYDMYYKNLSLKISPNPLIQVGDLAKIKIKTYKVEFPETQYWIVSSIKQKFDKGLSTEIILKPVKKVFDLNI
jgi:hypothetical protein